jgi:NodT family efflux transporter outer membrane factor (OMF) lipoprotein
MVRAVAAPMMTAMLAGCAVGPDFHRPSAPADAAFAPRPLLDTTSSAPGLAGDAQHLAAGQDVPFDWWKRFDCPPLDALVERSLRSNPTIEAAKASLGQAQQLVYAQQGYFFPTVGGSYNFERQKLAGNLSGSSAPGVQGNGTSISATQNPSGNGAFPHNKPLYFNFHTVELDVGYSPDVFGANRRQVESLDAQAKMQRFELEAATITLATNVVAAAIQEASTRAQIAATEDIIAVNRKGLEILKNQQNDGYAMAIDVAAQETALAQAEQALPPLLKQLEQTRDLIRMLAGNLPNEDVGETFTLAALHLPPDLPLSVPSKIIDQRPDVRAAEEQLRSANANAGVAIANRLPQFNLTGSFGDTATTIAQTFAPGANYWTLVGSASQTLFDGGTLFYQQRSADEALVQSAAQYRNTVITAYQNVADTLHAMLSDADSLKAATVSEHAARVTLDMTQRQNAVGYVNYPTLLLAEQAYQTAEINLIQARASRLGDTAALFEALGGGWWNRPADNTIVASTSVENRQ